LRIALSSLWIVAAVVALLIVACDAPEVASRDTPRLDIPSPTKLANGADATSDEAPWPPPGLGTLRGLRAADQPVPNKSS
jgi:hypothetical protein